MRSRCAVWFCLAASLCWSDGRGYVRAAAGQEGCPATGEHGADVIVGYVSGITPYGSSDATGNGDFVSAFAVGTTSCNQGDQCLRWEQGTSNHPVIRSGMFRLKNNQFEQIGLSWVKHGFHATNEVICNLDCQKPPGINPGNVLFPGCSDPYTASLNGTQSFLYPSTTINAFTGSFPFPPSRPPIQNTVIDRRLQVKNVDLNPANNAGALYYVDGQYVTADDAGNNALNNVSYRRATVTQSSAQGYTAATTDSTIIGEPAINAWKARDPSVFQTEARVPGEGTFILAGKIIDLGTGFWRYEYALYNQNSDRSGRSLTVPIALGASVANIGFHDVDYHSGEIWSGADWNAATLSGKIVWSTDEFSANPNANALRWGTLYNFRFDSNAPPSPTTFTLGLFKPGAPTEITIDTMGPGAGFIDCNGNEIFDACDVLCGGSECPAEPVCGQSEDCNNNGVPDECETDCNGNTIPDSCDLASGFSDDCNNNTVPDECEPDCNLNGIPDTCETIGDTDGDGVNDCDDACPLTTSPLACELPQVVGCLFPSSGGICIPNYPLYDCRALGSTPLCSIEDPGSCDAAPCPQTLCRNGCLIGDGDGDGDLDLLDCQSLISCFSGSVGSPAFVAPSTPCLTAHDFNGDGAIDLFDLDVFGRLLGGPTSP